VAIALVAGVAPSAAAPSDSDKFVLFGTAIRADSPTNSRDDVIAIDTSAAGSFGGAVHTLNQTVHSLDRRLSLDYYFVNRSCGGGSPRITLVIDVNNDNVGDYAADGFVGPAGVFTGCQMATWRHEDLTDGLNRWDIRSISTAVPPSYQYSVPWQVVETFFSLQPGEQVLRGIFVDDSAWMPAAAGLAYYDTIVMGDYVLEDNVDARLG
jgi:hypothetical protein